MDRAPSFEPYLRTFLAYYYTRALEWDRPVAVNYKYDALPAGTGVFDVERGQLAETRADFWQTDTSVSKNSWSYVEGHDYKQTDDLIADLVDIVSKNGALLLNIGPRADGTLPEAEVDMLEKIGAWLSRNGEAISAHARGRFPARARRRSPKVPSPTLSVPRSPPATSGSPPLAVTSMRPPSPPRKGPSRSPPWADRRDCWLTRSKPSRCSATTAPSAGAGSRTPW